MTSKKTIDPNYTELGNLFSLPILFEVPKYQRGYSWERSEIDDFCDDIFACVDAFIENRPYEHFFGSIVCVEQKSILGTTAKINLLVDGQQRTSTFIIFMSEVIRELKASCGQLSDSNQREILNKSIAQLEEKYFYFTEYRNLEEVKRHKLSLSVKDREFFFSLIEGQEPIKELTDSNKLLKKAKEVICDRLNKQLKQKSITDKVIYLQNIESTFNTSCFILKVTTSNNDQAYKLFQVLNDRGRALSAIDLLRASALGLFDTTLPAEQILQDNASLLWDEITKDPTRDLEKYFSYYYSSKKATKIRKIDLHGKFYDAFFKDKTSNLLYEQIEDIRDDLNKLKELEEGRWPYDNSNANAWEKNRLVNLIVRLFHTDCLPLLLAATKLKESKFVQIVYCLERFFFRYKTISNCRFEAATKIYNEEIQAINNGPISYQVQSLEKKLRDLIKDRTDDASFISKVFDLQYSIKDEKDAITGNRVIKYILMQFEENWEWLQKDLNKANSNRFQYMDKSKIFDFTNVSIEHVYPQNAKNKNDNMESLKNYLGNLTLLARDPNSKLGNKDFNEKKGVLTSSNYKVNGYFSNIYSWDESSFEQRAKLMKDWLVPLFSF
ncbi:TPA: DUF262 domain-containing protein [Aeromonas salmonicida subsp. smithia]